MRKRSFSIEGHRTSVALEPEFWQALEDLAAERDLSLSALMVEIDTGRVSENLASSCRLAVLAWLSAKARAAATDAGVARLVDPCNAGTSSPMRSCLVKSILLVSLYLETGSDWVMLSFSRYILSAGLASIADFVLVQSLLWIDTFRTPQSFGIAVVLGALLGMNVNFWFSRRFVFAPEQRRTRDQMRSFFIISLSTLVLRLIVAYSLVAIMTLPLFAFLDLLPFEAAPMRLAHVGAMGLVTIYSYFAHKHISFSGGVTRWVTKTWKTLH